MPFGTLRRPMLEPHLPMAGRDGWEVVVLGSGLRHRFGVVS